MSSDPRPGMRPRYSMSICTSCTGDVAAGVRRAARAACTCGGRESRFTTRAVYDRGSALTYSEDLFAADGFFLSPVLYPRRRATRLAPFELKHKSGEDQQIRGVEAKTTRRGRLLRGELPGVHRGPEAAEGPRRRPAAPDRV